MTIDEISNHLEKLNLDIRETKNARFTDQKVTSDVLTIIADCVIEYLKDDKSKKFTSKDIWNLEYSNKNIKDIFNKPDTSNEKAKNEYDKFFQQPLKALSYAGVLKETKERGQISFSVLNFELLEFLSIREKNALLSLQTYLEKVLKDSGIWNFFQNFFDEQTQDSFNQLKSQYENFIIHNTKINGTTETRRIFTKVLNPLAFKNKKLGTRKGNLSKTPISLDELFYNRINFRDRTKSKHETREEFEDTIKQEKEKIEAYKKYSFKKAVKLIKKYHSPNSEVKDSYTVGDATQVHHIFMKSEFPTIESYLENLILLTATQHNTQAHPNNNTKIIDEKYQKICLLAKADSIEQFPKLYSIDGFIEVLETGFKHELKTKNLSELKEFIKNK